MRVRESIAAESGKQQAVRKQRTACGSVVQSWCLWKPASKQCCFVVLLLLQSPVEREKSAAAKALEQSVLTLYFLFPSLFQFPSPESLSLTTTYPRLLFAISLLSPLSLPPTLPLVVYSFSLSSLALCCRLCSARIRVHFLPATFVPSFRVRVLLSPLLLQLLAPTKPACAADSTLEICLLFTQHVCVTLSPLEDTLSLTHLLSLPVLSMQSKGMNEKERENGKRPPILPALASQCTVLCTLTLMLAAFGIFRRSRIY